MALFKYGFTKIKCKKCEELELPNPNDSAITKIPSEVVVEINKTAKKHVHAASHGTPLRTQGPYLKISSTEKAVVCRYAAENGVARACQHFKEKNL